MLKLIDFNESKIAKGVFYGGDAGAKDAVVYENEAWMLKFPKTTRDFINPQISYTTSPLSEHLGSKIYETLGIPVHETLLGIRRNKVVVACKDFTRKWDDGLSWGARGLWLEKQLIPFHDIKNSFMSSDLESYSGTGSETLLDEVLATIDGQEDLQAIPGVMERFWDMFVVDAFIGNGDRNNGNWGILIDQRSRKISLAPVYDNGNAFFNKRSLAQMEKHMNDARAMQGDAYQNPLCAYKYTGLDKEGQKINPFTFIKRGENADCNAAVLRFVNAVDMNTIEQIIHGIPETAGSLAVMPRIQKAFYLELMHIRLNQVLIPAVK
ncbi:MAG: HipA domain-containing protein [Clostridiales bacterium]|nr:HipA domain-containing protein [Clostridiales bacterium]